MVRSNAALILVAALAGAPQVVAQSNRWATPKCDLKPGHFLVNSGLLYLKSATETRFEDQKQKDLRDANTVLMQALSSGNQEKNPAAWYYLGRYYILIQDLAGADSALSRAEALKPACKDDITMWRRVVWVPTLNAGIAAWQANDPDSAIKALRQANAILQTEPMGFKYLASLLYSAGQIDSAAVYFRRAADIAARDTVKYQDDRKEALFNLARIQHSQKRWTEAEAAYREYLSAAVNDAEALAGLGGVLMQSGQRDSAFALYRRIVARGDSAGALPLLRTGVEIFTSAPEAPDTAAAGRSCRGVRPALARVRACRDSMAVLMRAHDAAIRETYRLAAQAFEAGVKLNPYLRDGLFNLANTYLALNDSSALLPAAQRLVRVDPLNRQTLRLLAFAHQRMGSIDSTLQYLRLADSTLVADVTISHFNPQDEGAEVRGIVTNVRRAPNQPFKLVFDFLNAQGEVVVTQSAEVPAIAPQETHSLEVKVSGAGIVAWRYRKE